MKRLFAFIAAILLIGLILCGAVAFYTGKKIEAELPIWQAELIEQCQANANGLNYRAEDCAFDIQQSDRSLFSTQITLQWPHHDHFLPTQIIIDHGPFPFAALKKGVFMPQMISAHFSNPKSPLSGLLILSYTQQLKAEVDLNAFAGDLFNQQFADLSLHLTGKANLKTQMPVQLHVTASPFKWNQAPIQSLEFNLDYRLQMAFEALSLSLSQTSEFGALQLDAALSVPNLRPFLTDLQAHQWRFSGALLKQIHSAAFDFQSGLENSAYLMAILNHQNPINTAVLAQAQSALLKQYQQLNFEKRLFLEQNETGFESHLSLDPKRHQIKVNGLNLPYTQF